MDTFQLHFFKEKTRDINIEAIIAFFEVIEGFTIEIDGDIVVFDYTHPRLGYKAYFICMPKSQVKDIHRLNPRFLNINIHLEVPIISPDYFIEHLLEITKKFVDRFNYLVYNYSFEDVLPFRQELIMKVFNVLKSNYLELNPKYLNEYTVIGKDKLSSILRYLDDQLSLQRYYQDSNTYLPHYHLRINNNGRLRVCFEWKYDTLTVIPPYIDYIFLNRNNVITIIKYDEFLIQANKFLDDVPGFLKDTKVVSKKNLKKVNKILKKNNFTKVLEVLSKTNHFSLID